jgi:DNA-binding CsgD family transcriptional regulator
MVDGLPAEVLAHAHRLASRVGIDEPSALSHCAEAWALHPDMWHTVARNHCVDQRRHESGCAATPDHRPLSVLDEPDRADWGADDPELHAVEVRCDLAARIGGLCDADLAALARHYWLGMPWHPIDTMRGLRRARRGHIDRPLSPRELEVLALVADGLGNKQIAARLGLSVETIRSHLNRIYPLIGARDRAHATAIALRAGWIT